MPKITYLERYIHGEYEQVWNELSSLDDTVFQKDVYNEALEVARETMRRARENIILLIGKLSQLGYLFGYAYRVQPNFTRHYSLQSQSSYLDTFSWAREQTPVFVSARLGEETMKDALSKEAFYSQLLPNFRTSIIEEWETLWSPKGPWPYDLRHYVDELEQLVGPVPLSVRAWYEEVGGVNLYGYHAHWDALNRTMRSTSGSNSPSILMQQCDPLQVRILDESMMKRIRENYATGKFIGIEFADDPAGKDYASGTSTPYIFRMPQASADVQLRGLPVTFVQYLRDSILTWAGFPGMATWRTIPKENIAFLIEGLLPF